MILFASSKVMRSTAHQIALVACDKRDHSLLADDCVTDDGDTARSGVRLELAWLRRIATSLR
jgi:hypothetical protein